MDAEGYGGFKDQAENHFLNTFGSAIPQNSTLANQTTASGAARRNFAETFGRVAERTVGKKLDVRPTLEIRSGYPFNVLVDQDIVFSGAYRSQIKHAAYRRCGCTTRPVTVAGF